jgi:hypothetical protein
MGQQQTKNLRRELRKAFGPEASHLVQRMEIRLRAHAALLHRGFWGRMKWLILGK